MSNIDIQHLRAMAHSPIRNYIVPGLTSSLIGSPSPAGCVRLFECSRNHEEPIVPHSHRFDFHCVVLAGEVRNVVWRRDTLGGGDLFSKRSILYRGAPGEYEHADNKEVHRYTRKEQRYLSGEVYGMKHDEIHSIFFSRGATVLFFEGPTKTDTTFVLEPFVDGAAVRTFEVRPWMFQRGTPAGSSSTGGGDE